MKKVRICYLNTWADRLEPADRYIARVGTIDLNARLADSRDPALLRKARLDCDWYAENARCFAHMTHPDIEFLPGFVAGPPGLLDFAKLASAPGEEHWLIAMAHQPQALGPIAGKVFGILRSAGVRLLFYAFDEASRFMPCFRDIAPHLDVVIHDEEPLEPAGAAALRAEAINTHRSWVANFLPFSAPFNEAPEEKVFFLGSQLGLTDNRRRQFAALQRHFKDKFVVSHDHSISVADRLVLNRYKVGLCPEGRKFGTPAMSRTHTDRPFWSGCLGMVPVSENSAQGDRLNDLASAGFIIRYEHQDTRSLLAACERALATSAAERRRIYDHFNRNETVGVVVAEAIANEFASRNGRGGNG